MDARLAAAPVPVADAAALELLFGALVASSTCRPQLAPWMEAAAQAVQHMREAGVPAQLAEGVAAADCVAGVAEAAEAAGVAPERLVLLLNSDDGGQKTAAELDALRAAMNFFRARPQQDVDQVRAGGAVPADCAGVLDGGGAGG